MGKKSGKYIWEFVIGLGFLTGLLTSIGINPQAAIAGALGKAIASLYPDQNVGLFFFLLPTIILIISIVAAYLNGKFLGLVSVIVAYISGLLLLTSPAISLLLLGGAVFLGYIATNPRLVKKLTGR